MEEDNGPVPGPAAGRNADSITLLGSVTVTPSPDNHM
jgi:hypothetical protein